jgi:ribose transport system substrate-binding protein
MSYRNLVIVLAAVTFIDMTVVMALSPFFPNIAIELNTTVAALGQIQMATYLTGAMLGLLIGPLADHYGLRRVMIASALLLASALASSGAVAQDKKALVFVVNGASDFWKLAEAGVKKARDELPNYDLQFKYPEQAAAAIQQRLMEDLVAAGISAIMVSAVDPKSSTDSLNAIGGQVPLFTTDSDAPDTNRIAYIGSSNTDAGRQAGEIALQALPDGGKCIGFVGLPGADNARERIEGMQEVIAGSKVELIDVRGDDIDMTRAKRNVEDALAANPDIDCMVGFYSYNPPRIYEVLKESGKLGEIVVVAFDEDPITLGGVREGTIAGTVVQQPYEWGYQGMKLMAAYLEGDSSTIPDDKLVIVPTKIIDQSNVDDFEAELKARIGG